MTVYIILGTANFRLGNNVSLEATINLRLNES